LPFPLAELVLRGSGLVPDFRVFRFDVATILTRISNKITILGNTDISWKHRLTTAGWGLPMATGTNPKRVQNGTSSWNQTKPPALHQPLRCASPDRLVDRDAARIPGRGPVDRDAVKPASRPVAHRHSWRARFQTRTAFKRASLASVR
jgi:hypothetical protein